MSSGKGQEKLRRGLPAAERVSARQTCSDGEQGPSLRGIISERTGLHEAVASNMHACLHPMPPAKSIIPLYLCAHNVSEVIGNIEASVGDLSHHVIFVESLFTSRLHSINRML